MTEPGNAEVLLRDLLTHHSVVAGLDEVGRGSLAGPVVVGAVSLGAWSAPPRGLNDSKLLSAGQRERQCPEIANWALEWTVGSASASEVDEWGVRDALALASRRALRRFRVTPGLILVDGPLDLVRGTGREWVGADLDYSSIPVQCVVGGDRLVPLISAASVVAKVVRDAAMERLGTVFPEFGWAQNRGYGTLAHREALRAHGSTPFHRHTWRLFPSPEGVKGR